MTENQNSRISLCMIVKDEEQTLFTCLNSVKSVVDEMIIVDTGSTDRTVDIAKEFNAKVFHTIWEDDFSKARNLSLDKANGKWILHLDADEELEKEDIDSLLAATESVKAEGYFLQIVNHNYDETGDKLISPSIRLWRNRPEYRFIGSLHEQIGGAFAQHDPIVPLQFIPVRIHHYGYSEQVIREKRKSERNLKIALNEVKKHPESAFSHYNLAMEYSILNRKQEACQMFQRAVDILKDYREIWASNLFKNYAGALIRLGRLQDALSLINQGLEYYPDYIDLVYQKGACCFELGQYVPAVGLFHQCIVMDINPMYANEKGLGSEKAHNSLGHSYQRLNRIDESIYHYKQAYVCNPQFKESLYHLFSLFYRKDSMEYAEKMLLEIINPSSVEDYLLLAQILMIHFQFSMAMSYLMKIEEDEPKHQQIIYLSGICSMREGHYYQAIYWFEKINPSFIEYGGSRLFLYYCYKAVGQQEEAMYLMNIIEKDEKILYSLAKLYLEEAVNKLQVGLFLRPGSAFIRSQHISHIKEVMSLV